MMGCMAIPWSSLEPGRTTERSKRTTERSGVVSHRSKRTTERSGVVSGGGAGDEVSNEAIR